jgi:predicted secreted protein
MKKEIIFAVVLLFAIVAIGCKTKELSVNNNPKGDTFCVKKGDTFEIHFVANASLGKTWQYINKEQVTIVDSVSQRVVNNAPEGMVGKAVDLYLTFKATQKGTDTLVFKNSRIFDPNDEGVTITKIVHVR